MNAKTNASSKFGLKGWIMILYLGIGFFVATSMGSDLLNIYIPAYTQLYGMDATVLYAITTISGIISVFGVIIFSILIRKIGARQMAIWSCLIQIVVMILRPFASTIGTYAVLYIIANLMFQATAYVSAGNLTANWFPRKKGLVMGWATMGATCSTIFAAFLFHKLVDAGGLKLGFWVWTIFPVIMLLMAIFFIKNNPEERGYMPDNDPELTPEKANQLLQEGLEYEKTSPWTVKRLFGTRYAWFVSLGTGPLLMLSVGIMSSLVSRCMSVGFSQETSILILSLSAIVGLFGSYIMGFLDTKIGTKKATNILYVWVIVALALNLMSDKSMVFFYISIIMIACSIGGANNMPMSMISTVFGRYDFSSAYRVCWPIIVIIQSLGFAAVGALAAALGGSFTASYVLLMAGCLIGIIFTSLCPKDCVGRN